MGTNIQGPSLTPLYDNTEGEEGRPIHAEEDSVVAPMGGQERITEGTRTQNKGEESSQKWGRGAALGGPHEGMAMSEGT